MRATLVGVGITVAAYGGWLLVSTQEPADVREVALWALVAIVLHDLILAPFVILLGWLTSLLLRRGEPASGAMVAATVVLVLVGPVALAAIPVLGRFGAEEDNPTLLGGDYPAGLLAVTGVAVVAATVLVLTGLVSEGQAGRRTRGSRPRRR